MDINKIEIFGFPAIGYIVSCTFGLVGMNIWLALAVFDLDKGLGINYFIQAAYFTVIALACQKFRSHSAAMARADGANAA